tara:strand:- start:2973 stop:3425 length:453 start_codon:yes stop_codon:yes gene_type:complete
MARISTYENSSPVLLTDKVIGTNVSGTPTNVTKNFLVSDLLTLFQSNITLQNVLDAGNTATQSLTLTGNITQTGNTVQTGNVGLTGIFTLEAAGSMVLFGGFRAASSFEAASTVKLTALSTFADNAAAVAGGLAVNNVYKTASGELRIVV